MFKKLFIGLFVFVLMNFFCVKSFAGNANEISNGYFSFTMPDDTKGTYKVHKDGNGINIVEKVSDQAGLIGYAFGLKIYKNPADYAGFDGYKKIGELIDKKGVIYDMVLTRPSDVALSEGEEVQKNYDRLYEVGNNLEIKGINGYVYRKGQGTKGEDLYGDILKKHVNIIKEKWDYSQYIKSGLSPKYLFFKNEKLLDKIGYAYYDINDDGIDELFIGEITKGKTKGNIYNIYTMVNRKPTFVASADADEQFYVCNSKLLCIEADISKDKKVFTVDTLGQNSKELNIFDEYLFDKTKDKSNPWFVFKRFPNRFEKISKKKFNERTEGFKNYERFDFIPLSTIK